MRNIMQIRNLQEFLAHVGGDSAYQAGRAIYKYTDCGPWITYLVEETPERSVTLAVNVRLKDGKLHAEFEESVFDYGKEREAEALSLLGFNADGATRRWDKIGRTLAAYRRTVEAYIKSHDTDPATIGVSTNPYTLKLHPELPHDLGARRARKRVFITMHRMEVPSYREVYYESDEANTLTECAGIKMGSIVEGSEAYVDRDPMMFPFTDEEFDAHVREINDEASAYWERDNLDHYSVRQGKKEYYINSGWGRELKLPEKLREAVTAFLQTNDLEAGQTTTIPSTKIEIEKFATDAWGY